MAAALLAMALAGCGRDLAPAASGNLRLIDDARRSGQPTVVEFGSDACAGCRKMKTVLDAVAQRTQGQAHVLVMDVFKDGSLLQPYRIQMIPTQVFFDSHGEEAWRHLGPLTEDEVTGRLGLERRHGN